MQTRLEGAKQPVCLPTPWFANANEDRFSKPNSTLVKYHFEFSERSTRFPCDIIHPTLHWTCFLDFKRF